MRVEHVGDAAAWLVGTLAVPSVQGHRLPLLQDLWPYHLPNPGIEPCGSHMVGRFFTTEPPGKPSQHLFSLLINMLGFLTSKE